MEYGGKSSATPLYAHTKRHRVSKLFARPKAPSPLRSAGVVQNLPPPARNQMTYYGIETFVKKRNDRWRSTLLIYFTNSEKVSPQGNLTVTTVTTKHSFITGV